MKSLMFAVCMLLLIPSWSTAAGKSRVLIVHSYEKNHVCGRPQADGVITALTEAGLYPEQVDVSEFYMDTKRTYTTPEAIAERGRAALSQVRTLQPEVVVTLDDNAFKHVALPLLDDPRIQVVFSGMNGQPEDYDKQADFMKSRKHPGHNITGVYEKLHLQKAVNVINSTLPQLRKVVGITDYSPTGNALTRQFELEAAQGLPAQWEVRRVRTFAQYKDLIRELNAMPEVDAIYPVALTLPDGQERVTAPEIFRWTVENSTKPEIALNYFFSELGLFGGASVDFTDMGRHAGMQAAAVLQGESAGDIAIIEAPDYAIVFNMERAEMLEIRIPNEILLASDAVYKEAKLLNH